MFWGRCCRHHVARGVQEVAVMDQRYGLHGDYIRSTALHTHSLGLHSFVMVQERRRNCLGLERTLRIHRA